MRRAMPWIGVLVLVGVGAAATTRAQSPSPEPPVSLEDATSPLVATPPAPEGPVAVPEPTEKALRYYHSGIVLWLVDIAWGLLIPCVFLFTGFSARIRTLAARWGRRWYFTVVLYLILFALLGFVIDLPLTYYEEFVRQHAYGLSNQTFGKWMGDTLKELAVSLVVNVLFGWVPFFFLKKTPARWWLYTGLLALPFFCLALLVGPLWIAPLFNDFGPMKDKALERQILSLADRAGIEGGRVFEVNKSVDTKAVNAYVTGLGATKRIVLWDTILAKLDPREVLTVMGHEMGHYVLGHVRNYIALGSITVLAAFYIAHRLAGGLLRRFSRTFGFDQLADVASLPLLVLLTNLVPLAVTPFFLAFSRYQEHEGDRFSLEITHDNHALATAFVKLQEENLGVPRPHPLIVLFRSSHPPLGERIDFANSYRPWETGAPQRYAPLFKAAP